MKIYIPNGFPVVRNTAWQMPRLRYKHATQSATVNTSQNQFQIMQNRTGTFACVTSKDNMHHSENISFVHGGRTQTGKMTSLPLRTETNKGIKCDKSNGTILIKSKPSKFRNILTTGKAGILQS